MADPQFRLLWEGTTLHVERLDNPFYKGKRQTARIVERFVTPLLGGEPWWRVTVEWATQRLDSDEYIRDAEGCLFWANYDEIPRGMKPPLSKELRDRLEREGYFDPARKYSESETDDDELPF